MSEIVKFPKKVKERPKEISNLLAIYEDRENELIDRCKAGIMLAQLGVKLPRLVKERIA